MPNIAIVWDFDGTLSPKDSTSLVVNLVDSSNGTNNINSGEPTSNYFWDYIHRLRGDQEVSKDKDSITWQHTLASDTPIWMFALSQLASNNEIGLDSTYFSTIVDKIELYPHVEKCLKKLKALEKQQEFLNVDLKISHFIVTAGLRDLIRLVFNEKLVRWVWGCQYVVVVGKDSSVPENVPTCCMDETAKTRALFEISKNTFSLPEMHAVNNRIHPEELFCPFENMIYVGDGFSDVPALSLVRSKGGLGIVVFDDGLLADKEKLKKKIGRIRTDQRADLITEANFSTTGTLYKAILARCIQIRQKYEACSKF